MLITLLKSQQLELFHIVTFFKIKEIFHSILVNVGYYLEYFVEISNKFCDFIKRQRNRSKFSDNWGS